MTIIDLRGLTCPEPLLKLKQEMKNVEVGIEVEVLTTDPGTIIDIPLWAERAGIIVLDCNRDEDQIRFVLKKVK
jgi:TusA-related sulfurtransferase